MRLVSANRARGWSIGASVGALVSAFVASICCIGPLVFALLGISGMGLILKLEPYRTYLLTAALLLLSAAFYFAYRKPEPTEGADASPECACPMPQANRAGKIVLWVATVLVVLFLPFPYVAPVLFR